MNAIMGSFVSTYNQLIFSIVLYLRQMGLNFMSVNILNGILLLIMLLIAYQMFNMAKKAVIYLIILAIVMLPFIFLIISSFFYGGTNLNGIVQ
ncbi:MAG TPA: hypothetical protein PKW98_02950 [Candidatus Wallbacteria bacterium]|nr:MAG: hypothetical protein BWY32_00212 [bacterium ADurb.Bin243]HOD39872.1 hypothetical protein [Candidatus Wallbacteria bacterium]HPG56753.1 hypothetical protein [Candidatus Wallbacteria bacterium]